MRLQRAAEVALGLEAAQSTEPLDRAWFDALARTEAEVDDLEYETNAARMEVAARAKRMPWN